jgi:hypothetical protein
VFGRETIWVDFANSDIDRLYEIIKEQARRNDVAFWDISGTGAAFYPDGTVLQTPRQQLYDEYVQKLQEEYKKELKRRNTLSLIVGVFLGLITFVSLVLGQLVLAFIIIALLFAIAIPMSKWTDKALQDVKKKLDPWYHWHLQTIDKQALTVRSIRMGKMESGAKEFRERLPISCNLIRQMPGKDRPDYWLAQLEEAIEYNGRNIGYVILCLKSIGDSISVDKETTYNISVVTDESLLNDSSLDFSKVEPVAVCKGIATDYTLYTSSFKGNASNTFSTSSEMEQEIKSWLEVINTEETIPSDIKALNFGLFESENGYGICLTGSRKYDENDDDWACNNDYEPAQQYLNLTNNEMKWDEILKYVLEILTKHLSVFAKEVSSPFYKKVITVGFDDGDLKRIL